MDYRPTLLTRTISYNSMAKQYSRLYTVATIVLYIIYHIFIGYYQVSTDIDIIGVCINGVKTTFNPPYQYTNRKFTVGTIVEVYVQKVHKTHTFPGYIQAIHNTTSSSSSMENVVSYDIRAGFDNKTIYKRIHSSSVRLGGEYPYEPEEEALWYSYEKLVPVTIVHHIHRSVLLIRTEDDELIKTPVVRLRRHIITGDKCSSIKEQDESIPPEL